MAAIETLSFALVASRLSPPAIAEGDLVAATHELELPPFRERIDVTLRLGFVELVFRLEPGHQVVSVLEGGDLLGAEFAPLLLDLASHSAGRYQRCIEFRLRDVGHSATPKLLDRKVI